jgi:hypothetical protein
VPGTILAIARRRAGARVFALREWVLFALASPAPSRPS